MIINIVSGSPNFNIRLIKKYKADLTIGVDYGAYRLVEHQMKVDVAIGDFDSISTDQLVKLLNSCEEVKKYDSVKAKTDTELALDYALTLFPDEINIFGVTGKRIDHFLSVLYLFKKIANQDVKLNVIDDYNKITLLKPGIHTTKKSRFKYISFFSFDGPVKDLTLKGFKYELSNHYLNNEDSLTISNEYKNEFGTIQFSEGYLLIVESDD